MIFCALQAGALIWLNALRPAEVFLGNGFRADDDPFGGVVGVVGLDEGVHRFEFIGGELHTEPTLQIALEIAFPFENRSQGIFHLHAGCEVALDHVSGEAPGRVGIIAGGPAN